MPRPGSPPPPRVPRADRRTLSNGLRVTAVPQPGLPHATLRLVLPSGAVADPPEFPGAASLVGTLLTEGTAHRSANELNALLDALGASLNVQVGHDFVEIDLHLLSETLADGIQLLAEVVVHPAFPPDEVERVRAETLDALEARSDEPANLADDQVAHDLFGDGHPYGRLAMGTPAGVEGVPHEVLVRLHASQYRPSDALLVAAGDFAGDRLVALLEQAFAGWQGRPGPLHYPAPPAAPRHAGGRIHLPWEDAAQSEIRVAGIGMPRNSPRWVPAAVTNYIVGGSTITGRLGANLREDKGWTYGVRSGFAAAIQPGGWAVETAVDVEVAHDAVAEILGELERAVREPVDTEELRRAQDAMVLSLPRAFETPDRTISRFATLEAFGLPTDYWERFPDAVEAVTAEDEQRIAREFFDPSRLVQVVVGLPDG